MEPNLLDKMLNSYMTDLSTVVITLQNKIRITGKIKAFDGYVIILENSKQEIVFRHAVSSLSPHVAAESKQPPVQKPAQAPHASPRAKHPSQKAKSPRQAPKTAGGETSINSMKDELLRWMQEQKAK